MGLALHPEADLERFQVKVRFGKQFLEAGVLDLSVLQAAGLQMIGMAEVAGNWRPTLGSHVVS